MAEKKGDIPQKDYFRVKNDWWDALTHYRVPGEQMQILMHIIRKTYGWKRIEWPITITEFQKATGISRRSVFRALAGLKDKNLIGVKKAAGNQVRYSFNKYFKTWVGGVKKDTRCQKSGRGGVKKAAVGGVKKDTPPPINRKNILKNSLKNSSRKSKTFDSRSLPYLLSETLLKQITINLPDFKPAQNGVRETTLQRWSKDIDKMIRIDKRSPCAIWNMIIWCQHDDFWFANIQSGAKLRKQYDQLAAQINRSYRRNKTQHDKLLEVGKRWLEKKKAQENMSGI